MIATPRRAADGCKEALVERRLVKPGDRVEESSPAYVFAERRGPQERRARLCAWGRATEKRGPFG